jgi:hypothetical protein
MSQGHAERKRLVRLASDTKVRSQARPRLTLLSSQAFCAAFDRCFGRVYGYVSRRVGDRETCERIVRAVMTASLDALVEGADDPRELLRIKRLSDALIASEAAGEGSKRSVDP